MAIILPANTLSTGGYEVANSCRFNDGDSAYMHLTSGSAGNRRTFTFSCWYKRASITTGATQSLLVGSSCESFIDIGSNDKLIVAMQDSGGSPSVTTNQVFRDVGAWYHICIAVDTTQGTDTNRIKIYINGTIIPVADLTVTAWPSSSEQATFNDGNKHYLGANCSPGQYLDGYLAEVCLIDGQALTPTSFGEFDEDSPTIFKPIDVSGLTFGNEGWYLDFEDSGDLGDDESGNGNDFTEVNFAATDQATDTPTNNFCTMNPLFNGTGIWSSDIAVGGRTSEGNCKVVGGSHLPILGTLANNKMKVYYEVYISAADVVAGFMSTTPAGNSAHSYDDSFSNSIYVYGAGGSKINNGSWTSTAGLTSAGNYMFAFDPVAGKMWFGKDGTWTGDPAAGSCNSWSSISSDEEWTPYFHTLNTTAYPAANFGGCSAFTVSSGNTDANGYGNFEYAVPSGFYALCTKNLAELGG